MVIAPEGLKALLEGSEHRRRLLDWTLFHVEPRYLEVLQRYGHVLRQRNAALRGPKGPAMERELDVWDEQLAQHGERLHSLRERHVLSRLMAEVTNEVIVSVLSERVTWEYWPGWERTRGLQELLAEHRSRDLQQDSRRSVPIGLTSFGEDCAALRARACLEVRVAYWSWRSRLRRWAT